MQVLRVITNNVTTIDKYRQKMSIKNMRWLLREYYKYCKYIVKYNIRLKVHYIIKTNTFYN